MIKIRFINIFLTLILVVLMKTSGIFAEGMLNIEAIDLLDEYKIVCTKTDPSFEATTSGKFIFDPEKNSNYPIAFVVMLTQDRSEGENEDDLDTVIKMVILKDPVYKDLINSEKSADSAIIHIPKANVRKSETEKHNLSISKYEDELKNSGEYKNIIFPDKK